jgi:hypothetical protein
VDLSAFLSRIAISVLGYYNIVKVAASLCENQGKSLAEVISCADCSLFN